ncbi:MAG: cytochrome c family protein [Deltaproteobacteria bacterium]|nr:MAG: cytochrome c family protein [Deltaproteobacteria bacterium]
MFKLTRNKATVWLLAFVAILLWGWHGNQARSEPARTYVGSEACKDCHETEHANFMTFAKKAHSFKSILAMRKGLTDKEFRECFACHTTGYGKHGGFSSEEQTPHLKNAGCEVCHGPGSVHIETEDPEDIKGSLTAKDCEICHNSERVAAFNYKPLIYGGAH